MPTPTATSPISFTVVFSEAVRVGLLDDPTRDRLVAVVGVSMAMTPLLLIAMSKMLARVKTHLQLKAGADFLKDKNTYLESEVYRRTREVQAIQDVALTTSSVRGG